ncbi:hypothetical protein [Kocuria massiliensis]|uniref:hypothetical protein n=1 Tax=Kocuria massiliensis TaxID=1926282 RepID=UPI000A1C8323|nr:hypothetical protein [Kocuria massiliensis]
MNQYRPPLTSADVMTTRSLLAQGATEHSLTQKARSGEITRLSRGVYVITNRWKQATEREKAIARHFAVWKTARYPFVFSHASAALLHGINLLRLPDRIHITTPRRTYPHNPRILAHTRSHALDDWVRFQDGPHVTPLVMTAFECSLILPLREGLVVMDQVLARGEEKSSVEALVAQGRRRHGIGRARQVLELADPRCQSVAETLTRLVLSAPGLPRAIPQLPVPTREGMKYLDFGWPRFSIGLEVDGKAKYFDYAPTEQVVFQERHREKLITAEGWAILRTDWNEVTRDPEGLRMRLAVAMGQAR